jgi:hypothetical protein
LLHRCCTALTRQRLQERRFRSWLGEDNLLTVRAVADRLGVSTATVYGLVSRGELLGSRNCLDDIVNEDEAHRAAAV